MPAPNSDICIVSAALSGAVAGKEQCPAIPYTPEEYAAEARRACDAGASILHLHARRRDGRPSHRVEDYRAITDAVREAVPDVVINHSTGAVDVPREQRIAHIGELRPELAALNMGSMNFAKYSSKRRTFVFDHCFENRFETICWFLQHMLDAGVTPECECFDTGHVASVAPLLDMELLRRPVWHSLVLGVLGGAPPRARTLAHMAELVHDVAGAGAAWQVVGVSREQWTLVEAAIGLGGHVRVGLEDNFSTPDGAMAQSNGALVASAAALVQAAGRRVASPEEARRIVGRAAQAAAT